MTPYKLLISIQDQNLQVIDSNSNQLLKEYPVATAKNGPGENFGSECTPRGAHIIRAKIGGAALDNTVFIGRRPTGEIYQPELKKTYPNRDWILTRILWLSGKQPGVNRLGSVDTMRRYVYIHGCPDEDQMGIPSSHGCVKMRNAHIVELFDILPAYTAVNIT